MKHVRMVYLRNGAFSWQLHEDLGRYKTYRVEIMVPSWNQYLAQSERLTKAEKTIGDIGRDFTPRSYSNPGIRLSLSPDGKSILFPSARGSNSLWMLEGFNAPGWLDGLREMMPW